MPYSLLVDVHMNGSLVDRFTYQPVDRFWTVQAVEAAVCVGMAAVLLVLAVGLLRKRLA